MRQDLIKQLLIALGAAILFIPFLGQVHLFDWDEVNFAECAREMLVTKNYLRVQIDFQPFWEKPPLFIWMQALCMSIFGINEFAARLPNALIGIATLCTLFYIGKRVVNERMAWWWVILYAASWLPHFYFKTAIMDPAFNFFIFLAFFQVFLMKNGERKVLHSVLAGIFLGLAVLIKGPVAILVALLSLLVYLILNKGFWGFKWWHFLWLSIAAAFTTFLWFGIDIAKNGWWFTREFIIYQVRLFRTEDAGHGGPFFYHFIVLLIGCFPAAAFLFQSGRRSSATSNRREESDYARWMWILFWVTLILFSIVKTKIVHYSSLCYFPLTFLAALQLSRVDEGKIRIKKIVPVLLAVIGALLAVVITLLPWVGKNKEKLIPYFDDDFAVANLQAAVSWHYAECLYGIVYLAGIILALIWLRRSFQKGVLLLFSVQIFIIQITMVHFVPKVEAYSQRAAIEYYQSFAGKDVYLQPLDFVSYAYLFYSQKQPSTHPDYYKSKKEWLLQGKIDKPAYFITKITAEAQWSAHPNLEKIGEKNGFVFYRRKQ
jgi:4-amino-4-deoxy-L-arabinose transferase-like glycosyltransferase